MSERVLVTGAAGFLGSHVVRQLLVSGYTVRATARDSSSAEFLRDLGNVEIVEMDLLNLESVRQAVEGCDDIIHCAASLYVGTKDAQKEVVDPSVEGTKNLIEAMTEYGVRRVVHTSSVAAIRSTRYTNGAVFSADDWCEDADVKNNPYGLAKAGAERLIREWAEKRDVRLVTINPSILFGEPLHPRHMEGSMSYLKHFLKGPPFVLRIHINFVSVEDAAKAHVMALEKGEDRGRYLVHSGGLWMQDIGRLLKKGFPERKWASRRLPSILAYTFALFHPKLSLRMLRGSLGTWVDYDASLQSELLENVESPEDILIRTMGILLSQD